MANPINATLTTCPALIDRPPAGILNVLFVILHEGIVDIVPTYNIHCAT
jgi:hypothetical protein